MNKDTIRKRIQGIGWHLKEIPIQTKSPDQTQRKIGRWKLIAINGVRSIEVSGTTIDEAMLKMGEALGVISERDKYEPA